MKILGKPEENQKQFQNLRPAHTHFLQMFQKRFEHYVMGKIRDKKGAIQDTTRIKSKVSYRMKATGLNADLSSL